jgi:hypothetical protein
MQPWKRALLEVAKVLRDEEILEVAGLAIGFEKNTFAALAEEAEGSRNAASSPTRACASSSRCKRCALNSRGDRL